MFARVCVCACVSLRVHVFESVCAFVCLCLCMLERERERESERKCKKRKGWVCEMETRGVCVYVSVCVDGCPKKCIAVCCSVLLRVEV